MPFDEENNLLLPATTYQSELWPMLLAKALIKVANTKWVTVNSKKMYLYLTSAPMTWETAVIVLKLEG